jgi:hypothetical protein
MDPLLWLRLTNMSRTELQVVKDLVDTLLAAETGSTSRVKERVLYRGGSLQNEYRLYNTAAGNETKAGPYWYYKTVEDGKIRTLYIGKYDDVEDAKRIVDAKLS